MILGQVSKLWYSRVSRKQTEIAVLQHPRKLPYVRTPVGMLKKREAFFCRKFNSNIDRGAMTRFTISICRRGFLPLSDNLRSKSNQGRKSSGAYIFGNVIFSNCVWSRVTGTSSATMKNTALYNNIYKQYKRREHILYRYPARNNRD